MKYYSTKNKNLSADFRTAVIHGIADDGGLFMPETIPQLPAGIIDSLHSQSLQEIGMQVVSRFAGDIEQSTLLKIIELAINFDAPVKALSESLSILELMRLTRKNRLPNKRL